jgi:hypothetical protein
MTKMTTILLGTVAAVAIASTASAGVTLVHHGKAPGFHHAPVNRATVVVLYDQNDSDDGIGIVSQNFESSFDQYDAQAADDFTVPAGGRWKIKEVDVTGVYFNGSGPAASENVTFYKDRHGRPGKTVGSYTVTGADSFGSFVMDLGKGQQVRGGLSGRTYWVSVQANLDFFAGGEWGWENRTGTNGGAAQWQNPGNGFATGCSTWGDENVCIPDGQGDHMFTIRGVDHSG